MLLRVNDERDAALAAQAKLDAIEVIVGPDDLRSLRAIRAAFAGRMRLTVESAAVLPGLWAMADAVQPDDIAFSHDLLALLSVGNPREHQKVGFVAKLNPLVHAPDLIPALQGRVAAVMLQTERPVRLLDVGIARLAEYAAICRANGLAFEMAGGLEAPDVARLLLLAPDILGFDHALRTGHEASGRLDEAAVRAIHALMSGVTATDRSSAANDGLVTDRIFVRDFVVSLSIGAYQAEHGGRQRVRFNVDVDIRREPVPPRDMRDVFSYDIIIETIRVLGERSHVVFVETLAEEVAQAIVTHPAVVSTTVRVEKLDVIEGAVGIEIQRRPQG